MYKLFTALLTLYFLLSMVACKQKNAEEEETINPADVRTPVTVTTVSYGDMKDYVDLNATSIFLQKSYIKATSNGYIKSVPVHIGQFIGSGQLTFSMKTKEAEALGNTINELDPSFNFSGIIKIKAAQSGYITELNHQAGDFVMEGEQLAVLSNANSFGFVLNLPYELRQYLLQNKSVEVWLPDGTSVNGFVGMIMPTVDSASQTQNVLIKVKPSANIPQNLIARIRIITRSKENATSLPKEAILSDEAQNNFWVMKLVDSVTAIKVPVIKGMETKEDIEIIYPKFNERDKILLSGNYGLPDTAKVQIVKRQ